MSDASRQQYLRIALIVFGVIFTFGIYPLGLVWPSGWTWGQSHSHYFLMIVGVYATLGIFLIMAYQSLADSAERGHLVGDVPALLLVAVVLAALTPRTAH